MKHYITMRVLKAVLTIWAVYTRYCSDPSQQALLVTIFFILKAPQIP